MLLRRILTLGAVLAVLAVSVPLAAATLPANASEAAGQALSCPRVVLIGLHGITEGPSTTVSQKSPTIQATFTAFANEVKKLPNDGTSHAYRLQWFGYPTVPRSDFNGSYSGLRNALSVVGTTATQLYNYVSGQVDACSGTLVSVVGFSMGAWVINVALTQHYYMAALLNLAAMEGDPCWSNTGDGSAGLAQRAQEARVQLGCLNADSYPYLTFANPYTAFSVCVPKDPVCGERFNLLTVAQQRTAANNCTKTDGCPHFAYPTDGAAAYIGKWLADNAFT
jgi:hypothetical protein